MRSGSLAYLVAQGVIVSLVGAMMLIPKAASAFCRITTTETAVDGADTKACYDTSDPPVWWPGACIGLSVQQNGSIYASYTVVDNLLFQTVLPNWMNADCSNPAGGHPSIAVFDTGPAACDEQQANVYGPNANVVMFHDGENTATGAWPYGNDEADLSLTIALTTVTFHPETGALWDADMEINSASFPISTTTPVPPGYYDLQSILQHETGHVLGLAHPPVPAAVMYYAYSPGSDGKRVLYSDDIDGLCTIYPPSGERSVGPSIADGGLVAEGTCDATPRNGFSSACVSDAGDQPPPESSAACTCRAGRALPPSDVGAWGTAGVSLAWAARRRRGGHRTASPKGAHP